MLSVVMLLILFYCYAPCSFSECLDVIIMVVIMLNAIILVVIMLNAVMLSIITLNVVLLNVVSF
jgi:hypothetical protein